MNAGKLNRLVSIRQMASTARSTDGEPIITWSTISSNIWINIRPLRANEIFKLDQRGYSADTLFTLRYSTAINLDQTMRFIDEQGSTWDIKEIIDINDRHRQWQVIANRHA